ncbi:MAG: tail fiber domain-containing protein [Candidatus Paceibacterota bacterium]
MNIKKLIRAIFIAGGATFIAAVGASAQMGGGISVPSLWKKITGGVHPIVLTDTIGTSADRVAGVYSDLIDGTSFVIGGAVVGNLTVGGSATIYGGVTAPTFVATSTLADSTFNRLTWVNATGTNTTSTNLFATNLSATNIVSALTPDANNTRNIGSPTLSWKDVYASGTILVGGGSAAAPSYSFGADGDTGMYGGSNVINLTTAGAQRFKCDSGDCTVNQGLYTVGGIFPTANNAVDLGSAVASWRNIYASGTAVLGGGLSAAEDALSPAKTSYSDIGSETKRWNRLHVAEIYLNGGFVMAYEANTLASSTRQLSLGLNYAQDTGIVVRELALSGSTYGGASTVSLIESPTSTIKITNGTTGWGGLIAANVTTTVGVQFSNLSAAGAGTTNPLCLDSTGVGYIGASQICPLSSLASKTNLRPISYGLDELLKTNFYDFELRQDDGRTHSGIVADYLQKTMPNLVMHEDGKVNGYDVFSMVGVLGQSIKDLNAKVESQQKKIDSLEARLLKLEKRK